MKEKKIIGISIIGCGSAGRKRAQRIITLPYLSRLVSAYDTNYKNLTDFCSKYDLSNSNIYNYQSAIDRSDVDAVIVCVPNKDHFEIAQFALTLGKHVLCEKPLTTKWTEAQQLVQIAKNNSVFLKTGSNYRFLPNVKRAFELINNGLIGEPINIRGHIGHHRLLPQWLYSKELAGGGAVLDLGVHIFDLASNVLGTSIKCYGSIRYSKLSSEVETMGLGVFSFEKGGMALLQASWSEWGDFLSMDINGDQGYIKLIVGNTGHLELLWRDKSDKTHIETEWNEVKDSWSFDTETFLSGIINGVQPVASGFDGMMALNMVEQLYDSIF